MRDCLTADRTYYFDGQAGSDSNDGLTPATAWSSLQHSWERLADSVDLCGRRVTLQSVAPASFVYTNAGLQTCKPMIGQGRVDDVRIDGGGANFDQTNGTYVFMGGDIVTGEPAEAVKFRLQNMKLRASNGGCVNANGSKVVIWQDVDFGPATLCHMNALNPCGAIIADGTTIPGDLLGRKQGYTISGGAAIHGAGLCGAFFINHAMRTTITAPSSFSAMFLQGGYPSGSVYTEFSQYINAGLVTGKQFDIDIGGFLSTSGGVVVPGTIAGTIAGVEVGLIVPGSFQDRMWQR